MRPKMNMMLTWAITTSILLIVGTEPAQAENPCKDSDCQNGGTCVAFYSTYYCHCPHGFSGPKCEMDICGPNMTSRHGISTDEAMCKRSRETNLTLPYIMLAHGCRCHRGFLYDVEREECVDSSECGCAAKFRFYNAGESYLSENCDEKHTCVEGNMFMSQAPFECSEGEKCQTISPRVGKCQIDGSNEKSCVDGGKTIEHGGKYVLVRNNYCLACQCERGLPVCVSTTCVKESTVKGDFCVYGMMFYPKEKSFPAVDGCNTCYCGQQYLWCTNTGCEADKNQCAVDSCMNGGTCVELYASLHCSCPVGTTGIRCEHTYDKNQCAVDSCMNGGTCVELYASLHCSCPVGTTGNRCEHTYDTNFCAADFCMNGGTCTELFFSLLCSCPAGFAGDRCEQTYDICGTDMSVNESVSIYEAICNLAGANESVPDTIRSHHCRCRPGFLFDVELNKCVTMSECGCMKFDHFFRPGEEYLSEDCQVKNTCGGANQFIAEAPVGCKGNEVCKKAMDGVGYCEAAQRTDINQLIDGLPSKCHSILAQYWFNPGRPVPT